MPSLRRRRGKGISWQERGEKDVSSVQNTFPRQNEHLVFPAAGRRQTQKSAVGRWVGAGKFQITLRAGFGGTGSRASVVLLGRRKQLTARGAPVPWQSNELLSWNYSPSITQVCVHEAEQKSPKQESSLFGIFQKWDHCWRIFQFWMTLVIPGTVTGFLSGSLLHGSAWLGVWPLHDQMFLADCSAPRAAGLSPRYLAEQHESGSWSCGRQGGVWEHNKAIPSPDSFRGWVSHGRGPVQFLWSIQLHGQNS